MKKISLKTISESLSEREMKRVVGGLAPCNASDCVASGYAWDYANSVCDDGGSCVGSGNENIPYWCNSSNPTCKVQSDCVLGLRMNKIQLDFVLRNNAYRIVPDLLYLFAKQESIPVDTIKSIYNRLLEQSKTSLQGKLAFKQIEYLS